MHALFDSILPSSNEELIAILFKSKELYKLIALVCDIALHKNKKLAHQAAYDKDFKKYVATLFYHYYIDDCYNIFKETGLVSYPKMWH